MRLDSKVLEYLHRGFQGMYHRMHTARMYHSRNRCPWWSIMGMYKSWFRQHRLNLNGLDLDIDIWWGPLRDLQPLKDIHKHIRNG